MSYPQSVKPQIIIVIFVINAIIRTWPQSEHTNQVKSKELENTGFEPEWNLKREGQYSEEGDLRGESV
jgi:hypothetical protein